MLIIVALLWAGVLSWFDYRTRRLPNWLTVGGAALALISRYAGGGWPAVVDGFAAACLAGLLLLIPFLLKGAGGGDVKMLFAAGAITGTHGLFMLLWSTSVAGVVLGVVMMVMGKLESARVRHYCRSLWDWRYDRVAGAAALPSAEAAKVRVPFSLPIAVGLMAALLW